MSLRSGVHDGRSQCVALHVDFPPSDYVMISQIDAYHKTVGQVLQCPIPRVSSKGSNTGSSQTFQMKTSMSTDCQRSDDSYTEILQVILQT